MKRFLSITLCVMMIASLFAVNVSAAKYLTATEILTQDFDDAENTVFAIGNGKYVEPETEGSSNNVVYLDFAGASADWQVESAPFNANDGFKITFKAKALSAASKALDVEVYGGTQNSNDMANFNFAAADVTIGDWYTGEILIKGGWSEANVRGSLKSTVNGQAVTAAYKKACASLNDYTPEGGSQIRNYYGRIRFALEGSEADNAWMIDDIKVETLAVKPATGVAFEQNCEDPAQIVNWNVSHQRGVYKFIGGERGWIMSALWNTSGANANLFDAQDLTAEQQVNNTEDAIMTFDLCKITESPSIIVTFDKYNTSAKLFGIPAKQLRKDVWYKFAILRTADGTNKVWRKADGDANWTELTATTKDTVTEAAGTTDVVAPVYYTDTNNGSDNQNRYAIQLFTMDDRAGLEGADDAWKTEGAAVRGVEYLIDNFKVAKINDVEAIFTDNAGAVKAEVTVNENRVNNTTAKNVFIGYYDANNMLVDADFSAVTAGEAELNLTAAGKADMATAKLFVWDANNAPLLYNAWDITSEL